MTFDAYDIDAALIKELFQEVDEDFVFVNELTGEEIYIDNKTRRMKKKKKQFEEAIKRLQVWRGKNRNDFESKKEYDNKNS